MLDDADACEQSIDCCLGDNELADEARVASEGASCDLNPWGVPQETGARCHGHEKERFMTLTMTTVYLFIYISSC
jgi:hypothetical protein